MCATLYTGWGEYTLCPLQQQLVGVQLLLGVGWWCGGRERESAGSPSGQTGMGRWGAAMGRARHTCINMAYMPARVSYASIGSISTL
jgi:hypothetical protein